MIKNVYLIFLLCFFLSSSTFANAIDINVVGTAKIFVPTNSHKNETRKLTTERLKPPKGKYVLVEQVKLSPKAKLYLANRVKANRLAKTTTPSSKFLLGSAPRRIMLGMNNVPVLDQGRHSTCSTFSTTGIIDSVIGYDLISQLCYLELTHYLSKITGHLNGWKTNNPAAIFNDIANYGIVSKTFQQQVGCAGVHEYPLKEENNFGNPMPDFEYRQSSQRIMHTIAWKSMLLPRAAFANPLLDDNFIQNIKSAIAKGHRILIGMFLDSNYGNGSLGSYKVKNDSWILTSEIQKDAENGKVNATHGLIITGYDDDATVVDPSGESHKGLFTVRNSWGADAGDRGDYYISYAYFRALALSAHEVWRI